MKIPHYGIYDFESIGFSERTFRKKIYGVEPKICHNPETMYAGFKLNRKNNVEGISGYQKKNGGFALDNARDIIAEINLLEKDVQRYNRIGIEKCYRGDGYLSNEINFYKVAIRCQQKIDELRELL